MLRWMVPALAVMLTVSSALAADLPATPKRRAAVAAAPQEPPKVYVENRSDALISPAYGIGSYIRNLPAPRSCPARTRCGLLTAAPGTTTIRARITAGSRSIISGACPTRAACTATADLISRADGDQPG